MTEKKQINELNTDQLKLTATDTTDLNSKYAIVINGVLSNGKVVELGFDTEEDFQTWQELNEKMRKFTNRIESGEFDK